MIKQVVGLGADIVNVQRFKKIVAKHGIQSAYVDRLAQRILNKQHEYSQFSKLKEEYFSKEDKEQHKSSALNKSCYLFAGSWASKEALFKTLDAEQQKKFQFRNWFKANDARGKPSICFDNSVDKTDFSKRDEFMLTITHDSDMLMAVVLRQKCVSNSQGH